MSKTKIKPGIDGSYHAHKTLNIGGVGVFIKGVRLRKAVIKALEKIKAPKESKKENLFQVLVANGSIKKGPVVEVPAKTPKELEEKKRADTAVIIEPLPI
jgi:hypothetical protein